MEEVRKPVLGFVAAITGFATGQCMEVLVQTLLTIFQEFSKVLPISNTYFKLLIVAVVFLFLASIFTAISGLIEGGMFYTVGFIMGALLVKDYGSVMIALAVLLFMLLKHFASEKEEY